MELREVIRCIPKPTGVYNLIAEDFDNLPEGIRQEIIRIAAETHYEAKQAVRQAYPEFATTRPMSLSAKNFTNGMMSGCRSTGSSHRRCITTAHLGRSSY
jgi:hypothetical protein